MTDEQKKQYGIIPLTYRDLKKIGVDRRFGQEYYRRNEDGKYVKIEHITA